MSLKETPSNDSDENSTDLWDFGGLERREHSDVWISTQMPKNLRKTDNWHFTEC